MSEETNGSSPIDVVSNALNNKLRILKILSTIPHTSTYTDVLNAKVISKLVEELHCKYAMLTHDGTEVNLNLMVYNSVTTILLNYCTTTTLLDGDIGNINSHITSLTLNNELPDGLDMEIYEVEVALTKYMWTQYPGILNDIVNEILSSNTKQIRKESACVYKLTYEEEIYDTHIIIRMINEYIVRSFMLEELDRTNKVIKMPFGTAHIVQDNIIYKGNKLIDLLIHKKIT